MIDAIEENRATLQEIAEREDLRVSRYAERLLDAADGD